MTEKPTEILYDDFAVLPYDQWVDEHGTPHAEPFYGTDAERQELIEQGHAFIWTILAHRPADDSLRFLLANDSQDHAQRVCAYLNWLLEKVGVRAPAPTPAPQGEVES
jgi:hypothetical protein